MPETVEDLGKKVKAKYPGVYDSMADAEVGSKTKAKYPEAYGSFTDMPTESVGSRALRNLPRSAANFIDSLNPVTSESLPIDPAQRHVRGPGEDIGRLVDFFKNIYNDPKEAFANDPVGTIGGPVGLAAGLHGTLTSPRVQAGFKGAYNDVFSGEHSFRGLPVKLGGLVTGGAGIGYLLGGHEGALIGTGVGAASSGARGFFKGFRDYEAPVAGTGEKSGNPTQGRFTLGQYDAPSAANPPAEVGGGHIPDYQGPVIQPKVVPPGKVVPPVTPPAPQEFSAIPAQRTLSGRSPGTGQPVTPPVAAPNEISGSPSTGRFVPGQYDRKVSSAPIEVGGAHIPDYKGPQISNEEYNQIQESLKPGPVAAPAPNPQRSQRMKDIWAAARANQAGPVSAAPISPKVVDITEGLNKTEAPVSEAPSAFTDTESSGLQKGPQNSHRERIAETASRFLKANGVTQDQISQMGPEDAEKFWSTLGKLPGLSTQSGYNPSSVTRERILHHLGILESSSK